MLPQSSSGKGASGLWEQVDFPGQVLPAVESLYLELPSSPSVPGQRRVASGPWEQEVSQARAARCSGFHFASASATPRLSLMTEKSFRRREEREHFFQPLSLAEIPVGPPCQWCQALLVTVEGFPLDSWNKGASRATLCFYIRAHAMQCGTWVTFFCGLGRTGDALLPPCCSSSPDVTNQFPSCQHLSEFSAGCVWHYFQDLCCT